MKSIALLGLLSLSVILISCSNSQVNPLIGDYQSACSNETASGSSKSTTDCSSSNLVSPSFERNDNSSIVLSKLDKMLELSGRCDVKDNPDSKIQINLTAQGYSTAKLNSGYVPLIGITTYGSTQTAPVAKCEKGKWAIAINACANGLQAVGVHRIDLVLSGIDGTGRSVTISDGTISANINRTEACP